jgi:hypothetical protein
VKLFRIGYLQHIRQKALEGLSAELFPSEVSLPNTVLKSAGNLSDEELIERAKSARNGDWFRRTPKTICAGVHLYRF